jgi:hypothetical protein
MLLNILKTIPDHRRPEGREYYLHHILLFSILGLLSGSKTYTDLERFMQTHFEKLKSIFKLKWRRVPHFSAIRKIIIGVCPEDIESAFREFSNEQKEPPSPSELRQICFDGKTLNGSFSHVHDKRAFNVFQAFANYSKIILAHLCVEEKENEIPAFHEFLLSLNLKDCFVTADAMHFQKKL